MSNNKPWAVFTNQVADSIESENSDTVSQKLLHSSPLVRQGNIMAHQTRESQSPELSSKGSKNVTCRERLSKDH